MPPVRILIADDHTLMRQGLRELCERVGGFRVVAEAANGAQLFRVHRFQPAAHHLPKTTCDEPHPSRPLRPAPGLGRAGRAARWSARRPPCVGDI